MVTCLELGADLHMAQLMPLPLTISCFSKIQIGFAFLVPAHPGSPGKRAVKRVCVCVNGCVSRSADNAQTTRTCGCALCCGASAAVQMAHCLCSNQSIPPDHQATAANLQQQHVVADETEGRRDRQMDGCPTDA